MNEDKNGSVCLIVGNGLTYDLISGVGPGTTALNPSLPLWQFKSSSISYRLFIDRLPEVHAELIGRRSVYRDDFAAIRSFGSAYAGASHHARYDCQLRRFLALAYSSLQLELDRYSYLNWRWTSWLWRHWNRLGPVVSFNYDLVIERALAAAGVTYYRVGSEELGRVAVIKPHGSLDFELPDGLVQFDSEEDIWRNYFVLNDAGTVRVLRKADLLRPRIQPDLVPPSYRNFQAGLRWVRTGYWKFEQMAGNVGVVVIVGFSYQDVDRPEFDYLMSHIPLRSPIFLVDPLPNEVLVARLRSVGHDVMCLGSTLPTL